MGHRPTEGLGSATLIREWEYPEIGIVICELPSGGHDTVMLDYTSFNDDGEPTVVYVDEDRRPKPIAKSFAGFMTALESYSDPEARRA